MSLNIPKKKMLILGLEPIQFQNRVMSIKHNLIYLLITIRLATCFDPTGSSSGRLYERRTVHHVTFGVGHTKFKAT